jgi:hypothetical protein
MPDWVIHSSNALLTNSGPLSERRNSGAPCRLTRRVLVDHGQALDLLPLGGGIEGEVVGPDGIGLEGG